jgi:two-component system, NtrC family, nitrogen regulation sensor histidine kinase NtrY
LAQPARCTLAARRPLVERGEKLKFRRKLFFVFSLTVLGVVTAVAWIVSDVTRSAFERLNEQRTQALVKQFQREFSRRSEEVVHEIAVIAGGDAAARIAAGLGRFQPDYGAYIPEAKTLAESHQLDFLEFLDVDGKIISSAQWPAKFGYKDSSLNLARLPTQGFLKEEQLSDRSVLGLFAVRQVNNGDKTLTITGGRRLDAQFLASLDLPAGMQAFLYQSLLPEFSARLLIGSSGLVATSEKLAPIIQNVMSDHKEHTERIRWTASRTDDELVHAVPLSGQDGGVLGVLLIGSSMRPYAELNRRISLVALLVGASGILFAVFISSWAARRVSRPVEELAAAAASVASGNFNVDVKVNSRDELGDLAEAFNRMTRDLLDQRERLVQTERVAAWRELARRLAHELKNPLFPLQLTVENLVRAHDRSPEIFEEMFRESTSTLLTEIGNLKSTIARFSEFSKMPQPVFQDVDLNEVVQQVLKVFKAQMQAENKIECDLSLARDLSPLAGDPELLHRAVSNLVLNAMDAMPAGGTLTLRTYQREDRVHLEVTDSGKGLTPEECDRLFTPYYTTKQRGTGLGLAIVQSIISDHHGRISVHSKPGKGATFIIELPRNSIKLAPTSPQGAGSDIV